MSLDTEALGGRQLYIGVVKKMSL